MRVQQLNIVYFSATNTTRHIIRSIAKGTKLTNVVEYDITKDEQTEEIQMAADDLLVVGVPVYAGRIPQLAVRSLNRFRGNNTPVVVVCVYGNRDYDDALLELRDIVSGNQFRVVGTGVFIGEHSIFPKVAKGRPNDADTWQASNFGSSIIGLLERIDNVNELPNIDVTGGYPYRAVKKLPIHPTADKSCNGCGTCAHLCPTNAIDITNPMNTDKDLCIACARCIKACPSKSRAFRGILYNIASYKFTKNNKHRKANDMHLAK